MHEDEVVPQTRMDRISAWERHRFGITFVGDDWRGSEDWHRYESFFGPAGVRIVCFPYTGGVSSTLLRERLSTRLAAA